MHPRKTVMMLLFLCGYVFGAVVMWWIARHNGKDPWDVSDPQVGIAALLTTITMGHILVPIFLVVEVARSLWSWARRNW